MEDSIIIKAEFQNKGNWLKIFLPNSFSNNAFAIIKSSDGDVLKKVALEGGNNAIDLSNIQESCLNVKVETPYETVFKQIKINQK
jgi:hypothetical protein